MKRRLFIPSALALAAAAAVLLGACKAADTAGDAGGSRAASKTAPVVTTEVHADGVRRVGAAELQQMVEGGRVVIYDTRARASYEQEHIKGALSMPHEEVASREGEFPKDKTLVFYCT